MSARELRAAVEELDDAFLDCRYPVHAWQRRRAYYLGGGRRQTIIVVLSCRCSATAQDTLDHHGNILKPRRIHYPDGYLIPGHGRIDRALFRREALERMGIESDNGKR